MAQPTLNQVAAEMQRSQWQDFCINESSRVARFAGRLADAGQRERAIAMFQVADMLSKLAHDREQAA